MRWCISESVVNSATTPAIVTTARLPAIKAETGVEDTMARHIRA